MFLIIYSGQRYKIKIRKTNLRTIIFGWERELGGDGEEGRENWGGRQGTAEVEAYEALPRRTGTAGNGQGTGGDGGKAGWERRQGLAGNEGKDRWGRSAPTISYPLKAHDKRGA